MNSEIKEVISKIWAWDLQDRAIELINQISSEKHQQILKNPNFRTFKEWTIENYGQDIWYDENQLAQVLNVYESAYEFNKEMWPWIFNGNYYTTSEKVMLAFFKKYRSLIPVFLAKQTLVQIGQTKKNK